MTRLHATAVAIDGHAVLLMGRSGSGKSDLAVRLIDRGAVLVSDDYTELAVSDGVVRATPPARIAGKIEVRGIGIVALPHVADVPVALVVALDEPVERMPEDRKTNICGIPLPLVAFDAFESATPIKVQLALARARETA